MTSKAIQAPAKGEPMRAAWGAAVAERANECADAIDAMRGPGGLSSLREPQLLALAPFACRRKLPAGVTAQNQCRWEIYLPPGCVSCGQSCDVLNKPMAELQGYEDDDGWFLLYGTQVGSADRPNVATTETVEIDGASHSIVKDEYWWDVVVHAKTSAKVYGVDGLDAPARRMVYAQAHRVWPADAMASVENQRRWMGYEGDEYSQVVGRITWHSTVDTTAQTASTSWAYEPYTRAAISVAGRVRSNFDLVWYFSVAGTGQTPGLAAVEKVYAVRQAQAVAGLTVKGPTMTEVTDAEEDIYALITTNPESTAAELENVISVVCDPFSNGDPASNQFVTWLKLYDIAHNVVSADYRASSLVNVQTFR